MANTEHPRPIETGDRVAVVRYSFDIGATGTVVRTDGNRHLVDLDADETGETDTQWFAANALERRPRTPEIGDTVVVPAVHDPIAQAHGETAQVTGATAATVWLCLNDGPYAGAEVTIPAGSTTWVVV